MDLGRHEQFRRETAGRHRSAPDLPPAAAGEMLLAGAWAALATARAETVDVHLRSGPVIAGCTAIRVDGRMGEAATRKDLWTHLFPVEEVVLVRLNPRGGRRSG
jgi:hypothetical protein